MMRFERYIGMCFEDLLVFFPQGYLTRFEGYLTYEPFGLAGDYVFVIIDGVLDTVTRHLTLVEIDELEEDE